jgi:hypothetical protein
MKLTKKEIEYYADQRAVLEGQIAKLETDIQILKDENPTVLMDTSLAMHKIRGLQNAQSYKQGRLAQVLETETMNKRNQ